MNYSCSNRNRKVTTVHFLISGYKLRDSNILSRLKHKSSIILVSIVQITSISCNSYYVYNPVSC